MTINQTNLESEITAVRNYLQTRYGVAIPYFATSELLNSIMVIQEAANYTNNQAVINQIRTEIVAANFSAVDLQSLVAPLGYSIIK